MSSVATTSNRQEFHELKPPISARPSNISHLRGPSQPCLSSFPTRVVHLTPLSLYRSILLVNRALLAAVAADLAALPGLVLGHLALVVALIAEAREAEIVGADGGVLCVGNVVGGDGAGEGGGHE